jgi:hypothetical protein
MAMLLSAIGVPADVVDVGAADDVEVVPDPQAIVPRAIATTNASDRGVRRVPISRGYGAM